MNKKLVSFLTEKNFIFDKDGMAYSYCNDYQVSVNETKVYAATVPCAFVFSHIAEDKLVTVTNYVKNNKKILKYLNYEVTLMGVTLIFGNNKYNNLWDAISNLTEFLKNEETLNKEYCPYSGEPLEKATMKQLIYKSFTVFLDEKSVDKINEDIEKEEEAYNNAPNNYLKGTLGALVGGALGAIVWVVIGALFGFISGWIAFLIAILAGIGYDKMKGKANYTKIIVSSLVTLAYVLFSMFLVYVIIVQQQMKVEGIEGNPVSILFQLISNSEEIRTGFITDMMLGLLFGVIGVVISYFQMKKSLHQKQEKLK